MRALPLLLLLLLLPLLLVTIHAPPRALAASEATSKPLLGVWKPLNTDDPHVQEIAEFAVSEHDELANDKLALSKVVKALKGKTAFLPGIAYRLVVEAKDKISIAKYEAVVWEKTQEGPMKLVFFAPINLPEGPVVQQSAA
ncbi:cysteine proteinase inhibitor 1-like [Phoenix dactylifera]|uniref:Cysteine proteinase inhibitor 1-like n=1 Tax=Phoenix dactylifera TaxID=42345 RepID=A0A8B7CRT7_PHODC|nr:cysteine proteinase inhibitor 1-like [Phoenix dactylifera]